MGLLKRLRNNLGYRAGYGTCPHCGDSWAWKPYGDISYAAGCGVMICQECLQLPQLDMGRIITGLVNYGWPPDKVCLVKQAIEARNHG